MISKKLYLANGSNNRFLSDFIIRSDQYARPYVYVYDNTLAIDGTEDVLQDPLSDWSYPTNLYRRGQDIGQSEDLVTTDKWQVVDNSVLFYTVPLANTSVWLEVATTSEEFGETLIAPIVERAEEAAETALTAAAEAAQSAEDAALFDPSTYYTKIESDVLLDNKEPADATILKDADIDVTVLSPTGDGSGLSGISAGATGGSTDQVFYLNDQVITVDYTIPTGQNAMTAGSVTINDGVTVTIPDNSTWSIV